MAGDWIKMTVGLRSHPKVIRMASALKADKMRVVGGLHAVWSVFDQHSCDGLLEGYDLRTMDAEVGWRGFGAAMQAVEWLIQSAEGLRVPRFDEHNGASAKRRAMDAERKRNARTSAEIPQQEQTESGQTSALQADSLGTREEKRREEQNQSKDTAERTLTPEVGRTVTAMKLPRGMLLPEEWAAKAIEIKPEWGAEHTLNVWQIFRDHYVGTGNRREDWFATWLKWVRTERDERPSRSSNGATSRTERRAANIAELTGKSHERTIEGVAGRVGDAAVLTLPSDLREPDRDGMG